MAKKIIRKGATSKTLPHIVGTRTVINETGEERSVPVIRMQVKDFNFQKIWISHLLEALDVVGNRKTNVLMWLVNNRNSENIVIATQHKIAEMTNCSRQTVVDTLRALMDVGAIKQVANGVYQLDPNTIFKGDGENRQQILLDYEGLPTAAKIPDEKKKKRASEKPKSPKRKTEANL